MSKHTPGPWKFKLEPAYMNADVHGKNGNHVAVVWSGKKPSMEEVEANARLIAAAPELLEVVQMFFEWHANHFEDFSDEVNMQLLCIANAAEPAIAKAEGRE